MNYIQRYKKWKQFTTTTRQKKKTRSLWTIYKDTKNESNSQHLDNSINFGVRCELYTKIQKMKAIHNWATWRALLYALWTIYKDTKNESNSQRINNVSFTKRSCELYTKIQKMKAIHNHQAKTRCLITAVNYIQRYKKWKQFTTWQQVFTTGN